MSINAPKQQRETRQIELVETYNLYRSLDHLRTGQWPETTIRWKRALYHALGMTDVDRAVVEKIRQALELP